MKGNLMKRLLTLCLALVCCAGFALSQDDAKTLTEAEAVLANAAAPYTPEQFHALAMREILTGDDPATFAVMQERIAKAASQVAFKSDDERAELVRGVTISASLWKFGGRFVEEGYAYAKSAGVSDPYFALHAQKLGMSEADELAGYIELFSRAYEADVWIFRSRSNRFAALLSTLPEEEARTILKRLNRVYSPRLVENDELYRPVVTAIRTMLETY